MDDAPNVTVNDVERVVRREFPQLIAETHAVLSSYGSSPDHREAYRVRLAVLKIANGDSSRLAGLVKTACGDFRDVLVAAESSRFARLPLDASENEEKQALEADVAEYQEWLNAHG